MQGLLRQILHSTNLHTLLSFYQRRSYDGQWPMVKVSQRLSKCSCPDIFKMLCFFDAFTVCGHRMAHRKWKDTKLQPGTAGPGNMLVCCLVSFHFLWAILCPQAVPLILNTVRGRCTARISRSSKVSLALCILRVPGGVITVSQVSQSVSPLSSYPHLPVPIHPSYLSASISTSTHPS